MQLLLSTRLLFSNGMYSTTVDSDVMAVACRTLGVSSPTTMTYVPPLLPWGVHPVATGCLFFGLMTFRKVHMWCTMATDGVPSCLRLWWRTGAKLPGSVSHESGNRSPGPDFGSSWENILFILRRDWFLFRFSSAFVSVFSAGRPRGWFSGCIKFGNAVDNSKMDTQTNRTDTKHLF